jgi:D-alanyl-D-alanine dipeptidase
MRWDRTKGRPEPIRALNKIKEVDNGEPLVDLRVVAPTVKIGRTTTIPYCRQTVAEMVERAAQTLPDGVFLAVTDAFRPFIRQQKIYEWMMGCLHEAYPDMPYSGLRRRACRWVAPVDQKAPPGHCTGAALDIMLLDAAGEPLDLTSPFERFQASPTYAFGLSEEALGNRTMMIEAMLAQGFSNCRDEYWHYSYGDAGWAVRMGGTDCFYGLVELDESIWADHQAEWVEALTSRPNPFRASVPAER